jgi:hypothetical protein
VAGRRLIRFAALGALVAVPVAATPVTASALEQVTCSAAGTVTTAPALGGHYDWVLSGAGSCFDTSAPQSRAPQVVTIVGSGNSFGLGLCSSQGLVENLSIKVTATTVDPVLNQTRVVTENWGSPVSTYPLAVPVVVTQAGSPDGAGVIFTHIFAQCPPGGSSSASFDWSQEL